jgi:hypothetical protein
MTRVLTSLLLAFYLLPAHAGGTSVPVNILDIRESGTDRYVLRLKTLDTPDYEFEELPRNSILTINLRFDRIRYLAKGDFLTLDKYRKAVAMLKTQKNALGPVRFGRMGGGLCKVEGLINTYESDALDIYEEDSPNTKQTFTVVYSFCKYN